MSVENEILSCSHIIAIIGLSPNHDRPSYRVASYLKEHGYIIIPVNPVVKEILEEPCYPNLRSINVPVDVVDIFRNAEEVPAIVEEAINIGVKAVWMQEGIVNEKAKTRAMEAGLMVVQNKCMRKEHQKLNKQT